MSASERIIELPVRRVTLMEDRAHVERIGAVSFDAGVQRIRIDGVAPVLADKTLRLVPESGVRVAQLRIERHQLHRDQDLPEHLEGIVDRLRACRRRINDGSRQLELVEIELRQREATQTLAVGDWMTDAAWNAPQSEVWAESLAQFSRKVAELRRRRVDLSHDLALAQKESADLEAQRRAAESPESRSTASVIAVVEAAEAAEVGLSLSYVVPGACWRPYHTAELVDGPEAKVRFRSDACVWQNTGERWEGVELTLSTERPSLGVEPPSLSEDELRSHVVDKTVDVELREEKIQTTGLGRAQKTTAEVPGIDDGGDALALRAPGRVDVPSDGRPHRIALFDFESPAVVALVSAPELARAVLTKSEQDNRASHPLLAGPVDLIRHHGYVGRTSILYIAPGEKFELGWGPEVTLRVHRKADELDAETKMLSSWTTVRRRVTVRLSNIGTDARRIRVSERMPVSEVEKVKIEIDEKATEPLMAPDRDGFVRWEVDVPALGNRELKLGFVIKKHSDVVGV